MSGGGSSVGQMILAGHSHAVALGLKPPAPKQGAAPRLVPIVARGADIYGLEANGRTARYWNALVDHAAESTILIAWAGNQHLVQYLLASEPAFDVHLARHPDEAPLAEATLVPEEMVRKVMVAPIVPLAPLLGRLAAVRGCRPVVLGTPPPIGDDDWLRGVVAAEAETFRGGDLDGFDLANVRLTDRRVRRRTWLIVQDLLAETAAAAGCRFQPVPAAAMDEGGFLKPELRNGDASHANAAYGDLVWADLRRALATP